MIRRVAPWLLLAAVCIFIAWKLHRSHFDWAGFAASWRSTDFRLIALAVVVIYSTNLLRAMRWAVFLRPAYRTTGVAPKPWRQLVGSQFIGFASLAIFGRIGELIRPLIVAQRTGLTFSSQVAVVAVERVFDLGAFALLFALNLLLSPGLQSLPYHERFHTVGLAIAALTLVVGCFVLGVRLAGAAMASLAQQIIGRVSTKFGEAAASKILAFRDGLNVIDNVTDFGLASLLSLALWGLIALSYFLAMKAFPAPVRSLTFAHTLLLMGFSVVGSIVQLPGVGGGAQVGIISALTLLFSIPKELAISAGFMIWMVTTMSVIPAGLLYAKLEGISLRQVAHRSEAAEGSLDRQR